MLPCEVYVPRWSSRYYAPLGSSQSRIDADRATHQFAGPGRQLGAALGIALDGLEHVVDTRAHRDLGELRVLVADGPDPAEALEHRSSGAAAAVAVAKGEEGLVVELEGFVVRHRLADVANFGLGGVRVDRRHCATGESLDRGRTPDVLCVMTCASSMTVSTERCIETTHLRAIEADPGKGGMRDCAA
jgi:hypothetical protein